MPKITRIDGEALKELLKPEGKPRLINFWATWCDPCREEFPDLVKLDIEFKSRIDFLTVSLDDLAEIDRDVPVFLQSMKAEMPPYLLKTPEEDAAISAVSKDWKGGLPYTILIAPDGTRVYFKQGKIKIPEMRAQINALLAKAK